MHHYEYIGCLRDLYVACQFISLQVGVRHIVSHGRSKAICLHYCTVHVYSYDAAICRSILKNNNENWVSIVVVKTVNGCQFGLHAVFHHAVINWLKQND